MVKSVAPTKTAATHSFEAASSPRKGPALHGHTATVHVSTNAALTPADAAGKRISDQVMNVIGSYGRTFLLDTDGLRAHVTDVATKFMAEADTATGKGSMYEQLRAKFPGATVALVGTASKGKADQVYYLVKTRDGATKKFESVGGKPVEAPKASGEIFMAADLAPGKHIAVRVPEVRFLIDPTLAPDYGVGRTIDVVMDTPIDAQKKDAADQVVAQGNGVMKEVFAGTEKGEDGSPLGRALSPTRNEKGVLLKNNGDHTWDVEVTRPDGTKVTVKRTEDQIRGDNAPAVFDLHGATYFDVKINVDDDPSLKKFLEQAKAIATKDIPADGTPEEKAAGEKQALVDLTVLCNATLSYPDEDANTTDENSKKAMALMNSHSDWDPMKLGDLIDAGRGVCRHQAILMQLCCQEAGITSRPVTAAANDRQGNLRGYHAFLETTLDDGTQYLTDPTWFDAGPKNLKGYHFGPTVNGQQAVGTELWATLYGNVLRQELPSWTATGTGYDGAQVKFRNDNDPIFNAQGQVNTTNTVPTPTPAPAPAPTPAPAPAARPAAQVLADLSQLMMGQPWDAYQSQLTGYTPEQLMAIGDQFVQQGEHENAAFYYMCAIDQGATDQLAKTCWAGIAKELPPCAPGRADLVALANEAKFYAS